MEPARITHCDPSKPVRWVFEPGSKVRIGGGIDGVVAKVAFGAMGTSYLVAWWHDGQRYEEWLLEAEIEHGESKTRVGFH